MLPRMSSQVTDMGPGLGWGRRPAGPAPNALSLVCLRLTSSAFLALGKGQKGDQEVLELYF